MSDAHEAARRWLIEEGPAAVEVTAFNPLNGRSRRLGPGELRDVLILLSDYENAPDDLGMAARFEELGLEPAWFDSEYRPSRPLFHARGSDGETMGYSLRELLEAVRDEGRRLHGHPASERPFGRPRDKMLYIVDDDDSIRDLIAYAMRREGFQTDVFFNGAEVLHKIRQELPKAPDLIVLDLMMPQRGGYDVIRELQADDLPSIPIIVVTGRHIERGTVEELRAEKNVVDFLAKPLNPKTLALSAHQLLKTSPPKR